MSERQKKLGVTNFVSEIKRVETYPEFEILTHVIQHGLQGRQTILVMFCRSGSVA